MVPDPDECIFVAGTGPNAGVRKENDMKLFLSKLIRIRIAIFKVMIRIAIGLDPDPLLCKSQSATLMFIA